MADDNLQDRYLHTVFVSPSLEIGLLCAKHTFLAKQAYFSKENLRQKNIELGFLSYGNDYSPRPNLTPNEVTHLTLAPALTLHTNVLAFTFVNCNLRKISSDKVTPNILIINDLTCHLSLVTCTITHKEGPTQYTFPLQSWSFLHVLDAPLQCLEG